ncbi:hypothetical protein HYW17_03255 [Candidatus Uhrbacteria bacterium]|nr:hypothetical protein [Candidatus Uhrbacteria bacterium]
MDTGQQDDKAYGARLLRAMLRTMTHATHPFTRDQARVIIRENRRREQGVLFLGYITADKKSSRCESCSKPLPAGEIALLLLEQTDGHPGGRGPNHGAHMYCHMLCLMDGFTTQNDSILKMAPTIKKILARGKEEARRSRAASKSAPKTDPEKRKQR